MAMRLRWSGLEELKAALRTLPRDLAEDAKPIVQRNVETARDLVIDAYPEGPTGNLKGRVFIARSDVGAFGSAFTLKSAAPHAHLYEYGSEMRRTSGGASRGRMPGRPTFVPIVARQRLQMYRELAEMMRAKGLRVTGDVAA